jgi:hypothetical protein
MRLNADGVRFQISLLNDGTLDTIIGVQPVKPRKQSAKQESIMWPEQTFRFSLDLQKSSNYRLKNGRLTAIGLRELGKQAIELYDFGEAVTVE